MARSDPLWAERWASAARFAAPPPGRPGGHPPGPPRPDERDSRIWCLGNQSVGTTPMQNRCCPAGIAEAMHDTGLGQRKAPHAGWRTSPTGSVRGSDHAGSAHSATL